MFNILSFSILKYINQFALIVRGILLAKILNPVGFGEWSLVLLYLSYFGYLTFGSVK